MHDRRALGAADVTDGELAGIVAGLLRVSSDHLQLLSSRATDVPYDIPAITTAGRYWVRGHACVGAQVAPYALFVKHVQSWSRSPLFAAVPTEVRDFAEAGVPWRTEAAIYTSDLPGHLPPGLTMPRALAVRDLDEKSAAVWLEAVDACPTGWDLARFAHAAHLLGRLAASPAVRAYAEVGGFAWRVKDYLEGRLTHQVVPALDSQSLWEHPSVAAAFDNDLRSRLLATLEHAADLVAELEAFPVCTGHGDACPNNLLVRQGIEGFTLIDFGFWNLMPLAFDLGQLLVGDVQIGRRPADDLAERDAACVDAYTEGLRAEGMHVDVEAVRRAHALQLMIFTGFSAAPIELVDQPPSPEIDRAARTRAAIARFSLDLLDATGT